MFGRTRKTSRSAAASPDTAPVVVRSGVARLPGRPAELLQSAAWAEMVQFTDLRIRAHRGASDGIGELAEAVAAEVTQAALATPLAAALPMWRTWAEAAEVHDPGTAALLERPGGESTDDVDAALRVYADLEALMPQLVAARLSKNVQ